ncbi:MAG TPA: PilN domain-containing protein [Pyrinomonadaceae bacterium]|jgi:Tfp pilus assembly protein PilN|nr:PilN domain-containing protein [Pyrinomonadaceae bacterium]
MIKVNLLDSVTDRARGGAAGADGGMGAAQTRTMVLLGVVGAVTLLAILFHLSIAYARLYSAQNDLEKEKQIQQQMAAVNQEIAELDKKTKATDARINAIKKLRASQRGPVAVLSAINERLPQIGNFRLDSIEQKGADLIIKGYSPNEAAVTQFGRSLEFSSGLFTNVNMETARQAMSGASIDIEGAAKGPSGTPETVKFTVKCNYTPPTTLAQNDAGNPTSPGRQIAQK